MMFIQHIDTYFSFWIFYHPFTYQTVSTNYHTYCTCFKGLPNLPPKPPSLPPHLSINEFCSNSSTFTSRLAGWGISNTDDRQFLPVSNPVSNSGIRWFGDPKKKLQKRTHPNRSFIAGSNDPCRVS